MNAPARLPARADAAALRPLSGRTRRVLEDSKAPSTRRAYRSAWRAFASWCAARDAQALPAEPSTLADYLAERADELAVATLSKHLAAISKAHQLADADNPARAGVVVEVLRGIRRRKGTAQDRKAPATVDVVRAMVATLKAGPKGTRDRALLLLGFAGALRRSELVALDVGDLEETAEGLRVTLRRSKTDQEARGRVLGVCRGADPATCPVRALRTWLDEAGPGEGAVFRSVTRHGRVTERRLSGRDVARVVKAAAAAAGLDPATFAGHSLRAGHVTQAARAGAEERDIARTTGHRSVEVLRRYVREATVFRSASSGRLGL